MHYIIFVKLKKYDDKKVLKTISFAIIFQF